VLKVLVPGWVTSALRAILGLQEVGVETVVVNTEPRRFFSKVSAISADIPIALNLYQGVKIPKPNFSQFFIHVKLTSLIRYKSSLLSWFLIAFVSNILDSVA